MELTRAFLLGALFLVAFMLWNAWENEHPGVSSKPSTTATQQQAASVPPQGVAAASPAVTATTHKTVINAPTQRLVTVKTDVLNITIDTLGGNIVKANLLQYPEKADDNKSPPFSLLSSDPATFYVAQSGLMGKNGPDTQQGQAQYQVKQSSYTLESGQKELVVDLVWQGKDVTIHKLFTFKPNDYAVDVKYQIQNHSSSAWKGQLYTQLQRKKIPQEHSLFNIAAYTGGAISTAEKPYEKISFDKMAEGNLNLSTQNGWAAMQQHYFLSAWIPPANEKVNFYTHASDDIYTLGMIGLTQVVQPGTEATVNTKLYMGPEIIDNLKAVAPNLDLTVDYGILWFIAIALFWVLKHIYNVIGNWGWSIVLVTVLIKLAFFHLSAKSYRSMAAMRKLQPRLQSLKERHGDDRQKLTQATMELYKTEKINPLGGCLPMVVQIPVFIALYWVLLESVELRQAPFILWIHDLSTKDPYFILPILMGLTMFVQQKLNPPPPDPVQAKVMMFLPVIFTALFLNFPAGLVLYWVVNNSLSILQQWHIMRMVDGKETKKKR